MKVILFANTSWYIYNFRLSLARRLRDDGYEVILLSPFDNYTALLEEEGFRWLPISLARSGLNPINEIISVVNIYKIFKVERPDLVHNFTVKCVIYGSAAASIARSIRILNSVTGLGYVFSEPLFQKYPLRMFVGFLLRIATRNTAFIFQNPEDLEVFIANGWTSSASSYLVRSSGVNLKKFSPSARPSGPVTVLLPGRMLKDKGVLDFIEAIRLLRSRGLQFRAALVGRIDPGNPASITLGQLNHWRDEGMIDWWGWEDHMEMMYARAHIVCLPSYYREGLPMSLVEAAACGLPIIASDVPGCREIVHNNVNGLLIPPRNITQLADAMQLLIENPDLQTRFGVKGQEIASQFSSEHILDQIMKIYKIMLDHSAA